MQQHDAQKPRTVRVSDEPVRPNSLGLRASDLEEMLDLFDAAEQGRSAKVRREFVRWPFRHTTLKLSILHPGGTYGVLTVACRNISRGGMSVLHRSYLHAGTKCVVEIPRRDGPPLNIEGCVVRCGHRSGLIHEIGIRFARPIDVGQLVRREPFSDCFSLERVEPESLGGTLVFVDPSEDVQAEMRALCRTTRVRLRPAASIAEALPLILDGCDLVLSEHSLPDGAAADLIAQIREAGCATPVIITTADTCPAMRERLAGLDAAASLAKPLQEPLLLRAMGEFLPRQSGGSESAPSQPTATASYHMLRRHATELSTAMGRQDVAACGALCLSILKTAIDAGHPAITIQARRACDALDRTNSLARSGEELNTLVASCRRAGLTSTP